MKKFLLLLTLFLSLAGIAKGDTKEQVMADLGYSDAEAVSSFKVGDVNFAFSNAKYYNSGKSLRMYTGCNITITAPTGYTITGVQFDANSSSGNPIPANTKVSTGTLSLSNKITTWTGSVDGATGIKLTSLAAQYRATKISVTYTAPSRELGDIQVSYSGGDVTANSTVTVPNGTVFNIAADNATSITVNGTATNAATATYTATTSETVNVSATDGTNTKTFAFTTDVFTAPDAPTFAVEGVSTSEANDYFYGAKLSMTGAESIYYTTDGNIPTASNGTAYNGAITLPEGTTTYKAIVNDGSHDSAVTSATYTVKKLTAAWSVADGAEVYPGTEITATANAEAAKIFINGAEATSYTIPETAAIGSEITLSAYATVEADNATVTSETATITVKVVEQPTDVVIDSKFFGTLTQSAYKPYDKTVEPYAYFATVLNYQNSKLYWKTSTEGCGLIINCLPGYYVSSIEIESPSANCKVYTSDIAYESSKVISSSTQAGQITSSNNTYTFTNSTPQYVGLHGSLNFKSITVHFKKIGSGNPAIKLAWAESNFATDIVSKNVEGAPVLSVTPPAEMTENDALALVKYSSSKPSVATIDDNGNLEVLGLGATEIKAYIDDTNYQYEETSYRLVVLDPNAVTATDRLNKDCFEGISNSYSTFHYTSPTTGIIYAACTNYNTSKSGMTLNNSGSGSNKPHYNPGFGVSSNIMGWVAKKITVKYSETIDPSEAMLIVTREDNGFDIVTKEEATANDTYFGHLDAWAYLKEVGENNVPKIATPTSTDEPLSYTFEIGSEPKFLAVMTKNAHYIDYIEIEWEKSATPEVKILSEDDTSITVGVEHADYILHYKKIHNNNWNNHWGSEAANAPARVAQDTTGEPLADSEDWVSTGTNTITIDKTIADHQNRHYKFTAFHKDDTALANELNHVNFLIDGDGTLTGIEGIGAEAGADAPAEYYDLQGRRVANPVSGLYIRRTGSKVEKVFVK